jgi:hypothetical protein
MGLFDGVRDKINGVKTYAAKFEGGVKEITNIPDSIGKSVNDVLGRSAGASSGAGVAGVDHRCKINIKPSDMSKLMPTQGQNNGANASSPIATVLGPIDANNILAPLYETTGVLFPYTPTIQYSHVANYDPLGFTHSNYAQQSFSRAEIGDITISGYFTSETAQEAAYTVAAIHFFRTVTKMYFANPREKAGFPPPVLLLNYLGEMFNNVPVVVANFAPTFDNTVDLVTVSVGDKSFSVPVVMTLSVTLRTQYNPYDIKNEFNLDDFRTGNMLKRGYI